MGGMFNSGSQSVGALSSGGSSPAQYGSLRWQVAQEISQLGNKHNQKVQQEEAEDRAKVNTGAVQQGGHSRQMQPGA